MPLLPPPGPWYGVVRQATQLDPAQRAQNIDAFLALVERETGFQDELPVIRAARLLQDANERGDTGAAAQLLTLAADQPDSYELYLDAVTKLNVPGAETALLANPQQATAVPHALTGHAVGYRGDWAMSSLPQAGDGRTGGRGWGACPPGLGAHDLPQADFGPGGRAVPTPL